MNNFIAQFLAVADHQSPAVDRATFSFFAARRDEKLLLLEGRLMLDGLKGELRPEFQSKNIIAGQYLLSEIGKSVSELIAELEAGLLHLPHGDLIFPQYDGGSYRWEYDQFHPAGQQSRLEVLTVSGTQREILVDRRLLDWEVRAAATPYDNVVELANEYGLLFADGPVRFEAVSPAIIVVDFSQRVKGTEASIGVLLSKGHVQERAFLGYRVMVNKSVVDRGRLSGDQLEWRDEGNLLRGRASIAVPNSAIVECFAGYDGRAQGYGWIIDPDNHQNPRRSAYEVFDRDLKKLTEVLFREPGRGKNARSDDFETAVSWLFWIRGFSVSLLGTSSIPELKEGPDLLATTPVGHFMIVECTMGMLKENEKLPKVVSRATKVREQLAKSGSPHLFVLPVIVTSLSRSAITAELDRAAELGVLAMARQVMREKYRCVSAGTIRERLKHKTVILIILL